MGKGYRTWIPTPSELDYRTFWVRWMTEEKWSDDVADSIMYDGCPDLETVHQIVQQHGKEKAYRIVTEIVCKERERKRRMT